MFKKIRDFWKNSYRSDKTAVHHEYCKQKVFPFFDKYLPIKNNDLNKIVVKEQNLWDETNT